MGTNFYFRPTEGPLATFGELHIGKRSGGWQFSFQAYTEEGGTRRVEVNNSGLTVTVEVPPLTIKSYEDWKKLFRATPGVILNEYGEEYSIEEFEELVAEVSPGKFWRENHPLSNHYDELVKNGSPFGAVNPANDWKDEAGFSFSLSNFS